MLIKAFTIENFKGISKPVTINIKPITLLFGPNSSGKSSIIQALHYAREIFQNNNFNPDKTLSGGSSIDLGGFKNFVNEHDLNKTIKFSFDISFDPYVLPIYQIPDIETSYLEELPYADLIDYAKEVTVKIHIRWSNWRNRPIAVKYQVCTLGNKITEITTSDDGKQIYLSYINFDHPLFNILTDDNSDITPNNEKENLLDQLAFSIKADRIKENSVNLGILDQVSALPKWGEAIEFQSEIWEDRLTTENEDNRKLFVWIMSRLLVGSGEMLRNALTRFRYLGPLREVPTRNYMPTNTVDESRWSNGLAAWEALHKVDNNFYKELNDWLVHENKFNSGYSIELKRYKEVNENSPLMLSLAQNTRLDDSDIIMKYLEKLPVKTRVFIRNNGSDIELLPQDIGVGISQLLPVIIAALYTKAGIVAIEQPELHIHPALQVVLGDLFISQSKDKKVFFLIETHSEHLLLRLLRRIRETFEDELLPGVESLIPERLSVVYIINTLEGVQSTELLVSEDGDSKGKWPDGFFEERHEELI